MGIAVVGGGFAAVDLVSELVKAGRGAQVFSRNPFGEGVAFKDPHGTFFLNEPPAEMGRRYQEWLRARGYRYGPLDHTPRGLYEEHLKDLAQTLLAQPGVSFRQHRVANVALHPSGQGWRITDADGRQHDHDTVFFCMGHAPSDLALRMEEDDLSAGSRRAYASPTALACAEVDRSVEQSWKTVALIGEGSSTIDALRELKRRGYEGEILLVARPRLFPLWTRTPAQFAAAHGGKNYRLQHLTGRVLKGAPPARDQILQLLAMEIQTATAQGFSPYNVLARLKDRMDSPFFAPVAEELLQLRSHPMRPEDAALLRSRQIKRVKGEVITLIQTPSFQDSGKPGVGLRIRTPDGTEIYREADMAICCSPYARTLVRPDGRMRDPVLDSLWQQGHIRVKEDGTLAQVDGRVGAGLYVGGSLGCRPGDPWAVPNFREANERTVRAFLAAEPERAAAPVTPRLRIPQAA